MVDRSDINTLVLERVEKAVDAEMQAKGFKKTSDNPDILIIEHIGSKEKIRVYRYGYGYGSNREYDGYNPGIGGGISTYEYEGGSLILDFIDAETNKLVWRGCVKAEIQNIDTPEKSEKLIKAAVKKILKNYPPSNYSLKFASILN